MSLNNKRIFEFRNEHREVKIRYPKKNEQHQLQNRNIQLLKINQLSKFNWFIFTSFMICLALLAISARADDYWKTICVCPSRYCTSTYAGRCAGQPVLDSTSTTFMEEFNIARRNIKNIDMYFSAYTDFSLELDMRNIAGLTMNFSSYYYSKVNLSFTYVNGENYGGNYFNFIDSNVIPIFIPIPDSKTENVLRIGSINSVRNNAVFCTNHKTKTVLKYDSLKIMTGSLVNISRLNKMKDGMTSFVIGRNDHLTLKFSKTDSLLMVNEMKFAFEFKKSDSFDISGSTTSYFRYNDTLTFILDNGITQSDLPTLYVYSISNVEFQGKLWAPSESMKKGAISNIGSLTIPPGDFPFTILQPCAIEM